MAIDITNVRKVVFGVNYLGANGGAEVEALWKSRFADDETCLIQAEPGEKPMVIYTNLIEELSRKKIHAGGKRCLLVFFVDYTVELRDEMGAAIWKLGDALRALGYDVEAVIQFAYVGKKIQDDTVVPRDNVRKALAKNNEKEFFENYRLCIVGKPAVQSDECNHWKAAVVFVDLLRRSTSLQNYLPAAGELGKNDICFLRYGEFREKVYQAMLEKKKRLDSLLTNSGSSELNALVDSKRSEMIQYLEQEYPVNGALHPQHPDMIVTDPPGILLPWRTDTRRAAKEGKNPAYSKAQSETKRAVEATGAWLGNQIRNWFDEQISNADQTLRSLFEEANVGIKLKLSPVQMHSALRMTRYTDPGHMPSLMLYYTEQGPAREIEEYLSYIRTSGIRDGIERYSNALIEAFDRIPQSSLESQKFELMRERDKVTTDLIEADDMAAFCQRMALENPPEAVFEINTAMKVKNTKVMLCRNKVLAVAEQKAALGSIDVHAVDEHMCGVVEFDDAPVKAVMLECIACDDGVLNQLLPARKNIFDFSF